MRRRADGPRPAAALGAALEFLQHLWRLNHALERLSLRMEATLGVTAQQRLVIRCLGKRPGMTAGQLAALLHLDPGTISAALRRLERKGLLARRRDPRDRRRVTVELTAAGLALDRPAPGTVEHAVAGLLRASRSTQVEATTALLGRLIVRLEREAG
ncbi:MAG: MarR family transcriptional regulator [Deltaproteobacteria bacterium]|nr:MarR family transcriptional regulator [Deltaproteobacteria bacterium]